MCREKETGKLQLTILVTLKEEYLVRYHKYLNETLKYDKGTFLSMEMLYIVFVFFPWDFIFNYHISTIKRQPQINAALD